MNIVNDSGSDHKADDPTRDSERETPLVTEPPTDTPPLQQQWRADDVPDAGATVAGQTGAPSGFDAQSRAGIDTAAGGSLPPAADHLPRAGNLLSSHSEAADASPTERGLAGPPRPTFGLRRALDARGLGASIEDRPAAPKPAPPASHVETDPFEQMQAVIGAQPKRERRGWFGAKRPAASDASETPAGAREMVDLAPVREAMHAAALKRADVSAGDIGMLAEAAGVSDEAFGAKPDEAGPVGVLLVNLGTPDAPKPRAVRRYLREFLSDRRVIEEDTFVWQLVFRGVILPFRPRGKARAYRAIWNREKNESPIKTITRSQAEKLGEALAAGGPDIVVDWAMRYGNPSLESRIKALIAQGCERILLVPLYPQYSSATTATVCDEAFRVLSRIRNQPTLRVAPPYYADPVYIDAIASSIRSEIGGLSFEPEVLVVSYHGMPQQYVEKGDPYYRQCIRTTELLRERLGMDQSNLVMTFQSRFGRAVWLQPYTDRTLRKLAKDGIMKVAVVTPGFAADCLETLEEIAIENAHIFRKHGGKNFAFIPCLNDSERGMLVIRELAMRELKGWV
jgi:ferrochelatase